MFNFKLKRTATATRERVVLQEVPDVVYAVGDIHGRLDLLIELERMIEADAGQHSGSKMLVLLGDYVDRGPDAAGVLEHLLGEPPLGFIRYCLAGNHEELMLAVFTGTRPLGEWLELGGEETIRSYGLSGRDLSGNQKNARQVLSAYVPDEHIGFLRSMPILLSCPGYVFVHAGLRPGVPIAEQSDTDLVTIRKAFTDAKFDFGATVVHGHTPVSSVLVSPGRIAVDTAAVVTGVLSAVKLVGDQVSVLSTRRLA